MPPQVDLNADLGEEVGDDAAMLELVTSASVAAGGHAGGGDVLINTVRAAATRGVWVGAHVSYPDREGFGRESWRGRDLTGLADELLAQVLAVADAASEAGVPLRHVKAHGALYNDAAVDHGVADVLAGAIEGFRRSGHSALTGPLGVFAPHASVMATRCAAVPGVRVVAEAFADRAYRPDGTLIPRSEPGAVLDDTGVITDRAIAIVRDGTAPAHAGGQVRVVAQTLCIHGDTPGAVEHARALARGLADAGIEIHPWTP